MRKGLLDVLPKNALEDLTAEDFRLLVNGCGEVNVQMLISFTSFNDESGKSWAAYISTDHFETFEWQGSARKCGLLGRSIRQNCRHQQNIVGYSLIIASFLVVSCMSDLKYLVWMLQWFTVWIWNCRGKCGETFTVQALVLVHCWEDEYDRKAGSGKTLLTGMSIYIYIHKMIYTYIKWFIHTYRLFCIHF